MAEYRAYTVGIDGHFVGYQPLVCADDAEAITKAKRLVDGHDIELWNGARLESFRFYLNRGIPKSAAF
jgi:hypothetical protein